MILVSLARLRITPPTDWATAVVGHMHANLPRMGGQALANTMWALAKLGLSVNEEGLGAMLSLVRARLQEAQQQQSQQQHATHAMRAELQHAGMLQLEGLQAAHAPRPFSFQELSNIMYALACFRHRPDDDLLELLLGAARQDFSSSAPSSGVQGPPANKSASPQRGAQAQELSNMLWALAMLRVQPSDAWLTNFWAACDARMRACNSKDVSQLVYALARLGRVPVAPADAAQSAAQHSSSLSMDSMQHDSSHSMNLMYGEGGHAVVGQMPLPRTTQPPPATSEGAVADTAPPAWIRGLLAEAVAVFPRCNGQDLTNLSWGLAQLGVKPGPEWCGRFAAVLCSRCDGMTGANLATSLWALAKLGYQPAAGSLMAVEGALFRCVAVCVRVWVGKGTSRTPPAPCSPGAG